MVTVMEQMRGAQSVQAKKQFAALAVWAMYCTFSVEMLEEILVIGRQSAEELPDVEEVRYLNEALAAEISRRKASV